MGHEWEANRVWVFTYTWGSSFSSSFAHEVSAKFLVIWLWFLTFKLLKLFHYWFLSDSVFNFQTSSFSFFGYLLIVLNFFIFSSYLTIWILSDLWFSTIKFLRPYLIGAQVLHYSCIKYFQFSSFSSSGYVVIYFSTFILELYHYFVSTWYVFNSQASLVVSYSSFSLCGYEHFLVLKFQLMCLSTYGCQFSSFSFYLITFLIFLVNLFWTLKIEVFTLIIELQWSTILFHNNTPPPYTHTFVWWVFLLF
jgi:hypothetical protein